MKKNKLTNCFVYIILILIVSFIIEEGYVIIKNFYISKKDNNIINVSDIANGKNILKGDNNQYIEKLEIYYKAENDVDFKVIYTKKNGKKEYEIIERFDNEINKQVINIKSNVNSLKIISDNLSDANIYKLSINNHVMFNIYVYFYLVVVFILCYLLYYMYKFGIEEKFLNRYFMIVALLSGSVFIILQPSTTYYSWDDQIHFKNTFELFGGNFNYSIGEFSMIDGRPVGLRSVGTIEERIIQNDYLNKKEFSNYTTSSSRFITYSKYFYIIPAIGYNLGKILNLPFSICFRLGKFMILLSYVLIMGYAIKICKTSKKLLCVVGLIPTNIFLASQYSYDPIVTSGLTLAFVILLNLFIDKNEKVDFRKLLIFIISILVASFVKAVYIPFLLLIFLVPKDRFLNSKLKWYTCAMCIILFLLVLYTFVAPTVVNPSVVGDTRGGDTSIAGQLFLILHHPLNYSIILFKSIIINSFDYLIGVSSLINYSYLGYLSGNLFYLYFILIMFIALTENSNKQINGKYKIGIVIVSFVIIVLIWTALYLSFTPVGYDGIFGVQARYYLPFVFPLLICLNNNKIKSSINDKYTNLFVFGVPSFVLMCSIYEVILLHFCL